tara:strand:+ start:1125 stop:1766 length:642 start_codon:yes stop_codon:yes gene_type:complete
MKRLSLLSIFFLFSCSDVEEIPKEKSELERCIEANLILFQEKSENLDVDEIINTGYLNNIKIKLDFDTFKYAQSVMFYDLVSLYERDLGLIETGSEEYMDLEFKIKSFYDLGDIETASKASFEELKEFGFINEAFNINLDADEVYFTMSSAPEEGDSVNVRFLTQQLSTVDPKYLIEEDIKLFNSMISSSIKLADDSILNEVAQRICWSQGIY